MSTKSPSRDALQRIAETSARYREAFLEVQRVLASLDLGRVPSWTFAIDGLPLEEVAELSQDLAEAEERRRAWRTCLHALTELVALEDPSDELVIEPAEPAEPGGDAEHNGKLDRFITIVNFAKAGGCIYVDGGFQPVTRAAPPQEAAKKAEASPFPEGAHIEMPSARELVRE